MSLWRRTAIEKFPQLHRAIADAESASWAWYALRQALQDAYRRDLLDEKFVGDVYKYASWCLHHRSIEVRTSVVLWFYEGLCVDELLRPDLARWVSQEDFDLLKFAWDYILKGERLEAFQQEFAARKAVVEGIASKHQRNMITRLDEGKRIVALRRPGHPRL